jgi:hypothetical protein
MANYTKATNFTAKDGLPTGNSGKIVKGAEIDTEFTAIASAISSKADLNSPALTGTPTTSTATAGTNTTQIASTAYVRGEITALSLGNMSTQAKTAVDITGGTIVGITDLAVADGGTGRSTLTANAVLVGNGTSGINSVAPSTSGNVLTSDGTSWTSAPNTEYVKAWINFNGTGTPAIRGSNNVTSITDHSTGQYTVNFTTALPDTNYAVVSLNNTPSGDDGDATQVNTYATTSVRLKLLDRSGNLYDATHIHVVVFR